jgi:hypothetical protein
MIRRVVEGEKPEDGDDEEEGRGEDRDEEDETKRREVYLLKGGKMKPLSGGVGEFERSLEKKVQKLLEM